PFSNSDVVYQPRASDACCGEHDEVLRVGRRRPECFRIAHHKVVGTKAGGLKLAHAFGLDRFEVPAPSLYGFASALERREDARREGALFWSEVTITRAHREPIGLARRRQTHDLDGHTQIFCSATNDHELLIVLLAEQRDIG